MWTLAAWMEERSMDAVPENLMAYVRTTHRTSRRRRNAITAARMVLRTAGGVELAEADEPEMTLDALMRLWNLDQESAWISSWVALPGCRGLMVLASKLMWKPTKIEIGNWIQCRDNKKGRTRNSRILPSWRRCL